MARQHTRDRSERSQWSPLPKCAAWAGMLISLIKLSFISHGQMANGRLYLIWLP
jgi:hypothetical protein